MEQLLHLDIQRECNELPLLIDPALDDAPVFRQSVQTLQGTTISADKALPFSTLLPWVKKMGALVSGRSPAHTASAMEPARCSIVVVCVGNLLLSIPQILPVAVD